MDNSEQLAQTLSVLGADLLVETLLKLESGSLTPIPQDSSQATYAPLIKKEDYWLSWSRSAFELHNQVRGFFPDCVATFRGAALKISSTAPIAPDFWSQLPSELRVLEEKWFELSSGAAQPGEVVAIVKGIGPIVQTVEGLLLLRKVQVAGERPKSGLEFANGMRLAVGEVLENGH